ncbi:MAG: hypothetical protein FWE28_02160 [Oscillospiraceae bacterium]|nr:hypothetical protein [Oscillospiraceae bacterium]
MNQKINFDQFLATVTPNNQEFVQILHNYLTDNACKASFEEKKSGTLASYKVGKPPKALVNLLLKPHGLLVRIYGENAGQYHDFLQTLPAEMVQSISDAPVCKRLVHNTCSPKCSGYDVTIRDERFQRCRYGGFEFLVTDENVPCIKPFIEHEMAARAAV